MFNLFKKKEVKQSMGDKFMEEVYKEREEAKKKEEEAFVAYRFGLSSDNRVEFTVTNCYGFTMNKKGCQTMIDQLTFYMNKLEDENETMA